MKENILANIKNLRKNRLEQANQFSPEKLTKETLAPCFGLSPEQISDEELAEIQEFALNAGLEMIANRSPENTIGDFFGYHDIFHAAERMRVSKGHNATPDFITNDNIGRYTNPEILRQEFYPVLFLPMPPGKTVGQLAQNATDFQFLFESISPEAREKVKNKDFAKLTPQERYELILKAVLEKNSTLRLIELEREDLIPEFLENLDQIFNSLERPAHYTEFAQKVFAGEWQENPRLFLDQFLSDIRILS